MLAAHQNVCNSGGSCWPTNEPHDMGTTLVAAEFPGGVVIGADSRTSTGVYVANRVSNKITRVTDSVYCCRSGSAADTQTLAQIVAYRADLYGLQHGDSSSSGGGSGDVPVALVARLFRNMCYDYRDQLMAGIICAGYDAQMGGQIFSIPIGGMMVRQKVASGGSGSTYIYGYLDSNYRPDFTAEQCVQFIKKAVSLAIHRDGSSGGVCRVAIITSAGVERRTFTGDQLFIPNE